MPSRQPIQPASAIRRRIVAAAREHFFAHGFRRVTMDDLAEELGMSKKTLYAHFPGKRELVLAIVQAKFEEVEAELSRLSSGAPADFPAELRGMLGCLQHQMEEIRPPFVRDVGREEPEFFELIQRRRHAMIQRYFGKLLRQGRRAGIVRKDIPVAVILEILLGAIQAIMNPVKLKELGFAPHQCLPAILKVVLEGALNSPPRSKR